MCSKCVLNKNNNGKNILCVDFEYKYPEVAEEKIEKWWKEEEFKEKSKINFTPELLIALNGKIAEGLVWIHVHKKDKFSLHKEYPLAPYPTFTSRELEQVCNTYKFPIYKDMIEKLFEQGKIVVNINSLLKENEEK